MRSMLRGPTRSAQKNNSTSFNGGSWGFSPPYTTQGENPVLVLPARKGGGGGGAKPWSLLMYLKYMHLMGTRTTTRWNPDKSARRTWKNNLQPVLPTFSRTAPGNSLSCAAGGVCCHAKGDSE